MLWRYERTIFFNKLSRHVKGVGWSKASLDLVIGWLDHALISAFPGALALEYRRRTSAVPHKNVKQTQWYPSTRTHPISVWRTSRHKSALPSGSSVTDEMWCGSSERHAPTTLTWGTDVFRKIPATQDEAQHARIYLEKGAACRNSGYP